MANWWQSIRQMLIKIKRIYTPYEQDVLLISIVVLVAAVSFGLGRLSVSTTSAQEGIAVRSAPLSEIRPMYFGGEVVASKNGTKYHFPWCAGALSMSQANMVWFKTIDDARRAGYTPASNCKGLR